MKPSRPSRVRGEAHPKAKHSDEQISQARHAYEVLGMRRKEIAAMIGCSYWTLREWLEYRTRKTAPPMPDGVTLAKKRKGPTVETVLAGWRGIRVTL
jgi:transposase